MGDAEQDSPGESPASSIIEPAAADPPYADPAQDAPQQLAANPAAKPHTASLAEQARALYRKSATFQMRNITTNVCIVSAPVLFCILLLLLQVGVQKLMSGSEFQVRWPVFRFVAARTTILAAAVAT
jgi:hypothetical protein